MDYLSWFLDVLKSHRIETVSVGTIISLVVPAIRKKIYTLLWRIILRTEPRDINMMEKSIKSCLTGENSWEKRVLNCSCYLFTILIIPIGFISYFIFPRGVFLDILYILLPITTVVSLVISLVIVASRIEVEKIEGKRELMKKDGDKILKFCAYMKNNHKKVNKRWIEVKQLHSEEGIEVGDDIYEALWNNPTTISGEGNFLNNPNYLDLFKESENILLSYGVDLLKITNKELKNGSEKDFVERVDHLEELGKYLSQGDIEKVKNIRKVYNHMS